MKKRFALAGTLVLAAIASLLAITIIFSGTETYLLPTDCAESYARYAIDDVCGHGYIDCFANENGEIYFLPNRLITRAEFAKILVKFLKINPDRYVKSGTVLADADEIPAEYSKYVRAAVAEGLMGLLSENGKTYFLPLENVTREEAAYMLGNLIDANVSTFKTSAFSDYSDTSELYLPQANVIIAFEIMIGYPDGTLRPKNDITREELALMLFRMSTCGEKYSY